MASRDAAAEVAPELWATGAAEGLVFVGNPTNFDMALDPGSRLGIVVAGTAQTRHCWAMIRRWFGETAEGRNAARAEWMPS